MAHDQARKGFDKRYRKILLEREKTIHKLKKDMEEMALHADVNEARVRILKTGEEMVNKRTREREDIDNWMIAVYDDECRELRRVVGLLTEGFGVCDVCKHHICLDECCESLGCDECEKDCPCRDCEAGEHVKLMEEYR